MRILKLFTSAEITANGIGRVLNVDDQTAIGITLQAYDIKEPGKRKVNITNSFTLPKTSNNFAAFGWAGNPQSDSSIVYDSMYIDYWVDNQLLIDKAKIRVEEIGDRITCMSFQKDDVWDLLKLLLWPQFENEFVVWMGTEGIIPTPTAPFAGNFSNFIQKYAQNDTNKGVLLPFYYSNLARYQAENTSVFLERGNDIYLQYGSMYGGHFTVYIKTIFQFLEHKFGVSFVTNGDGDHNIFKDSYALRINIPFRNLYCESSVANQWYFDIRQSLSFAPLNDVKDKADKTLGQFVTAFFQHFYIIVENESTGVYRLNRFDEIDLVEPVDWSDGLTGTPTFKPLINGYCQSNKILFKSVYPDGDASLNSKIITCDNKNIDATTDLFTIDAYVPSDVAITGGVVPDLSLADSFKTFVFLIRSGVTTENVNIKLGNDVGTFLLFKAAIYSLDSEYTVLQRIASKPRTYTIKKWLTLTDIINFKFFKLYYFRTLNGSYFINKIKDFNPQKSLEPTEIEVVYVNDKVPFDPESFSYWTDGFGNPWTDGTGVPYF